MTEIGLREDQVKQVRGFADQQLRKPEDPQNPGNRRVSVIVRYQNAVKVDDPDEGGEKVAGGGEKAAGGEGKPEAKGEKAPKEAAAEHEAPKKH